MFKVQAMHDTSSQRKPSCRFLRPVLLGLLLGALLAAAVLANAGYRLSPEAALAASPLFQKAGAQTVVREAASPDLVLTLADTGEWYYTVYARRIGPLWWASADFGYQKFPDAVELLGKCSAGTRGKPGTGWVVLRSHDPAVQTFSVQVRDQELTCPATPEQPVVLLVGSVPAGALDVGFGAQALDADGRVLYTLGYREESPGVWSSEYRWLPADT